MDYFALSKYYLNFSLQIEIPLGFRFLDEGLEQISDWQAATTVSKYSPLILLKMSSVIQFWKQVFGKELVERVLGLLFLLGLEDEIVGSFNLLGLYIQINASERRKAFSLQQLKLRIAVIYKLTFNKAMFNYFQSQDSNKEDFPSFKSYTQYDNISIEKNYQDEFSDDSVRQCSELKNPNPLSTRIEDGFQHQKLLGFYCPSLKVFIECTPQEIEFLKVYQQKSQKVQHHQLQPTENSIYMADSFDPEQPIPLYSEHEDQDDQNSIDRNDGKRNNKSMQDRSL